MKLTEETLCSESYIKKAAEIKGRARPYAMCVALGQIYNEVSDPKIRLKLRYIATLAIGVTTRLSLIDKGWLKTFYPSYHDYDVLAERLLKDETVDNS